MDRETEAEAVKAISSLCAWVEFLAERSPLTSHYDRAMEDCKQARELLSELKGEEQ